MIYNVDARAQRSWVVSIKVILTVQNQIPVTAEQLVPPLLENSHLPAVSRMALSTGGDFVSILKSFSVLLWGSQLAASSVLTKVTSGMGLGT